MIYGRQRKLPDRAKVEEMLTSFLKWLDGHGYETYDPYDLWSTGSGRAARRVYYRSHILGAPLVAPFVLADMLLPNVRTIFAQKKRYPTADGHLILGSLKLYGTTGDSAHLKRAEELGEGLLEQSIPGFSGHCWGFPFEWESSGGWIQKNTPLITTTPYCFEAFLALYDATKKESYLRIAESSAVFVSQDIHDTPTSETASACSYTPFDRSKVINANAYRAMMLFEAHARFGVERYREQACRNLNFLLESQEDNGAWVYEPGSVNNNFIDNFHTCFTLKNLVKINHHCHESRIDDSILRGYRFYRRKLFNDDGTPKPFAAVRRFQPVRLEGYDVAEGITLGVMLKGKIPGAFEHACSLCDLANRRLRLPDGYFASRISRLGVKITVPFLRWPLAQLFHGLALLHASLEV